MRRSVGLARFGEGSQRDLELFGKGLALGGTIIYFFLVRNLSPLLLVFLVFQPLGYPTPEVLDLLFFCEALVADVGDTQLHLGPGLLRLEGLPHAVRDGAFVQGLVRLDRHLDLVTHPDQQEAALGAVDGHLSDDLVEGLRVQLLADRADSRLARLPFLQLLV